MPKNGVIFEGLLVFLMIVLASMLYAMVASSSPAVQVKWNIAGNDTNVYTYIDGGGTAYSFMGRNILAIGKNGDIMWEYAVPDGLWVSSKWAKPVVASDNGTLYVYAHPFMAAPGDNSTGELFAISPGGKKLWGLPVKDESWYKGLDAGNGRVYLHDGHQVDIINPGGGSYGYVRFDEVVIDGNGTILWRLDGLSAPAAIDEEGYVYSIGRDDAAYISQGNHIIEARYPNGTLYWQREAGVPQFSGYLYADSSGNFGSFPLYDNGTIYVLGPDALDVFGRDGSEKWKIGFNGFLDTGVFDGMPFDRSGNLYLKQYETGATWGSAPYITIVGPDGSILSSKEYTGGPYAAASDGVLYYWNVAPGNGESGISDFNPVTISSYDLKKGEVLWQARIPAENKNRATLNAANVGEALSPTDAESARIYNYQFSQGYDPDIIPISGIQSAINAWIVPGRNATYVALWGYNYEAPAIFDRSACAYFGGVYAIDDRGDIIWRQPADSYITSITWNGDTVYYSTAAGKMSATSISPVESIAILTAAYVFIRFIAAGSVARARNRLDSNRNRARILEYVIGHPGSTARDISRGLGMNLGTIRYHLLILGLNHRVVEQRADRKYVRYFHNSNSYTGEERLIISLMKREQMSEILAMLAREPGVSNRQISRELGISDTAASNYMKELYTAGVVEKASAPGNRLEYAIKSSYVPVIEKLSSGIK